MDYSAVALQEEKEFTERQHRYHLDNSTEMSLIPGSSSPAHYSTGFAHSNNGHLYSADSASHSDEGDRSGRSATGFWSGCTTDRLKGSRPKGITLIIALALLVFIFTTSGMLLLNQNFTSSLVVLPKSMFTLKEKTNPKILSKLNCFFDPAGYSKSVSSMNDVQIDKFIDDQCASYPPAYSCPIPNVVHLIYLGMLIDRFFLYIAAFINLSTHS